MDSYCPIVHVFPYKTIDSDAKDTFAPLGRKARNMMARLTKVHPARSFKYRDGGIYFRLQRKRYSTFMIFYHYYNNGQDNASIYFTTFPKRRPSLLLQLKPPYKFNLVKNTRQPTVEWENRQIGPFNERDLSEGWHGYSVRLTKATFTLHHISKRGKPILVYRAAFMEF